MTDPRMRSAPAPSRPLAPMLKTLKYRPAQEHLLRRLAGALVLQWDALPDDVQDLIIDQAALAEDREDAPHLAADFESFIRHAKTAALAKAPAKSAGEPADREG